MSFNIQNNPFPNWQEVATGAQPQMYQPLPTLPLTQSHHIFAYTQSSGCSPMVISPHNNQFGMHSPQMQVSPDCYSANDNQFQYSMITNFPKDYMTPTRFQHQGIFRHKPSPLKSTVINPVKRQRSIEDERLLADQESKGIKGIQIDSVFYDLQRFAYEGCTFAEQIAQIYCKRPCFKKIDLLLSRLKNDLSMYHNILSNVNSQGTAWAIKDFTFAYSRIINAWVILRGYVYDQTEGLDNLRSDFDEDYLESFAEWQSATLRMMKSLMRTVENLNTSAQYKSGVGDGIRKESLFKSEDKKTYSNEFLETFQKTLFTPQCAPNSEEIQIRNHHSRAYFRAGVLKPLMIDAKRLSNMTLYDDLATPSPGSAFNTATPSPNDDCFNWWSPVCDNESALPSNDSDRLYNRGKSAPILNTPENPFDFTVGSRAKKTLIDQFNSVKDESK
ncbi:hypothetical protein PVAND_004822 [Polypedilum vanderplanki]|uniref:Uncharacterized protein n=1 Tax=Polypedilum vanderplanki TaxID=319348 RepID=A0A9J6BZ87_POLVA|nr:hypothetical protein PVAND_004822 [Polypedilum vanderplanki]